MNSRISIPFGGTSSLRRIHYVSAGLNLCAAQTRKAFVRVVLRGCELSVSNGHVGGTNVALHSLTKTV